MSETTMHDIDLGHIRQQAKEQNNPWFAGQISTLCDEIERLREMCDIIHKTLPELAEWRKQQVRQEALEEAAQVADEMDDVPEVVEPSRIAKMIRSLEDTEEVRPSADETKRLREENEMLQKALQPFEAFARVHSHNARVSVPDSKVVFQERGDRFGCLTEGDFRNAEYAIRKLKDTEES